LKPRQVRVEKRMRQAREMLEESIHQPLHLDVLCRDLGMSRRGMEMMFRKSLGMTPGRYLMCQRLNGVRRELISSDPTASLVKEAAFNWGFLHMGHFGKNYRNLFGETPTATLKKR
jgi:AraC family ethanolamine operon transcriptional activator